MARYAARNDLKRLITMIKQAVLDNKSWLVMPKQKYRFHSVLRLLVERGYIEGFEETKALTLVRLRRSYATLALQRPVKSIQELMPIQRMRRKSSTQARDITKTARLEGQAWDYFINTDRGITLEKDGRHHWRGGMPLFKVI